MNRTFLCLLLICFSVGSPAQKRVKDFKISSPNYKVPGSLYTTIGCIDVRKDTTSLGLVHTGGLNFKARAVPNPALRKQLSVLLDSLNGNAIANGELLLQVRKFNMLVTDQGLSGGAFYNIRASLYSKTGTSYQRLSLIDTSSSFTKFSNPTDDLFKASSDILTGFLGRAMTLRPQDTTLYSFADVLRIDSIEKLNSPAFVGPGFRDGVYRTFRSFRDQRPNFPVISTKFKGDNLSSVITEINGSTTTLENESAYAVVYQGRAFISTKYGYYLLKRVRNDLCFIGKAKAPNQATVAAATIMFGIAGRAIASNATSEFEMKLDQVDGSFIKIKEVSTPASDDSY